MNLESIHDVVPVTALIFSNPLNIFNIVEY